MTLDKTKTVGTLDFKNPTDTIVPTGSFNFKVNTTNKCYDPKTKKID